MDYTAKTELRKNLISYPDKFVHNHCITSINGVVSIHEMYRLAFCSINAIMKGIPITSLFRINDSGH